MTPVGNKESRREKRREKHNLRNERMAARALDVWSRMGIKTSAAPRELKELLGKLPRIYFPTFELEGVEPGPQLDAFLDAVVDEVTEPTEEWGISTSEFFEICMPCAEYVGKHARAIPFDAFDAVDKVCRPFYEKWHSAMRFFLDESMRNLHVAAVDESRLNGIVWRLGLRGDWAPWFHLNVVVYSDIPEQRKFVVDGVPRPAWRVMTAGYSSEPKSIEWDTKALELEGPPRKLPVYVQGHALERLLERVPVPNHVGDAHRMLAESLNDPKITSREPGRVLVEYRWGTFRLGHLHVTIEKDAALVRTFLFLTMTGTPESNLLREKLKLTRYHIDKLELNSLETFLMSDLANDPELRKLFEECGMGHLFTFVPADAEPEILVADDVRSFLKERDLL